MLPYNKSKCNKINVNKFNKIDRGHVHACRLLSKNPLKFVKVYKRVAGSLQTLWKKKEKKRDKWKSALGFFVLSRSKNYEIGSNCNA